MATGIRIMYSDRTPAYSALHMERLVTLRSKGLREVEERQLVYEVTNQRALPTYTITVFIGLVKVITTI